MSESVNVSWDITRETWIGDTIQGVKGEIDNRYNDP